MLTGMVSLIHALSATPLAGSVGCAMAGSEIAEGGERVVNVPHPRGLTVQTQAVRR